MPKRKTPDPQSKEISDACSEDEHTEVAADLIQKQKEQQNKRRSRARAPGSRVRTSIWTTLAATKVEGAKPMFQCMVCDKMLGTNRSFSSSNFTLHYESQHNTAFKLLKRLNEENATEEMLKCTIKEARKSHSTAVSARSIRNYFRPAVVSSEKAPDQVATIAFAQIPTTTLQAVALVLFACLTETSFTTTASPVMQGFIDIFGGRMQQSSKDAIESHFHLVYSSICAILRKQCTSALTGNLTIDGWSAALNAPILGITWKFNDDAWRLKCIPVCMLNTGTASKSGEQVCSIVTEVLKQNLVIGSEKISIHTITSDNEASVALACDLLTNYVGSVRCVVHTLALCVNDVFTDGTTWQTYMDHVNKVTSYFNYHAKSNVLFIEKQRAAGVTNDRLHRLKHNIPTRWHSRLGAMLTYLTDFDHVSAVKEEMEIDDDALPTLTPDELVILAEFVKVLAEVRRVARQLEADQKVSMSRSLRLLRELYETLRIMADDMEHNTTKYFRNSADSGCLNAATAGLNNGVASSFRSIQSSAKHCEHRDDARSERIYKRPARKLALLLSERIEHRLGCIWKPVDNAAIFWKPENGEHPDSSMREPRRVLLFHIAAILDINECELECLSIPSCEKDAYFQSLYSAVAREAIELGDTGPFSEDQLTSTFSMFHDNMRQELKSHSRRAPQYALQFWKEMNSKVSFTSPLAFNKLAKASLSSQASSSSAERLFSNLGRSEGRERQATLNSTLEMTEMIRGFMKMQIEDTVTVQRGLLHPVGAAFKKAVQLVALEVNKSR